MNGWIKIHRSLLEWEHFGEPSVVTVYLALLLSADRDGVTDINLGGLINVTKLSSGTIKRAIAKLVKSGEITREKYGMKITTKITMWSEYQLGQKLSQSKKSLVQKLDQYRDKNCTNIGTKIDPIPHYNNNKNVEESNKNISTTTAPACARERLMAELLTDGRIELAMMQHRITEQQYRQFVAEILADWDFRSLTDEEYNLNHFSSVLRFVVDKSKRNNNGTDRQPIAAGRAQRAAAIAATMAALAAESGSTQKPPF